MSGFRYDEKIPNNVDLSNDRRLQRALEAWQPHFLDWWQEMGPEGFQTDQVYLRTAINADPSGWAHFDYVRMPDYRWGIFLAPEEEGREISFGENKGKDIWREVPGELRAPLRRLIVIQGDTEPASVEQQRLLGRTCPSLYDLRNLFQVNVEEGRHLWAMVYLLHAYFGRDGREEAEAMLERRSGNADHPRLLGAFNERTPDWLAFFLFTTFTDRDGKFQLASLAESGFDPLARTCRFMLAEESHHMFVGVTGVQRIVERTCEVMRETGTGDPRSEGVIDLDTIQKYINFHYAVTLDLFGAEVSTNAANFFSAGLKGRFHETRLSDDHVLREESYPVLHYEDGAFVMKDLPALTTLNERLREDFQNEAQSCVDRWNKAIESYGIDYELKLPHAAFNRRVGHFADLSVTPDGAVIDKETWQRESHRFLPTEEDRAFVGSLMSRPVIEPGKFSHWIAPPRHGIDGKPLDFEYVRFA